MNVNCKCLILLFFFQPFSSSILPFLFILIIIAKSKQLQIDELNAKIVQLETSYEGKVDRQIVKSLLISYFATVPGTVARSEGERLLARFLDFNQQEMERAGIKIGKQLQKANNNNNNKSFTSKFVEFLEAESQTNSNNADDGGEGRRTIDFVKDASLSSSVVSSLNNSSNAELARDLNKRLNIMINASGGTQRPNPFVPQLQYQLHQHHQRTSSSASSSSSTSQIDYVNQLFQVSGIGSGNHTHLLPAQTVSGSGGSENANGQDVE